jgi:hypothetical protein
MDNFDSTLPDHPLLRLDAHQTKWPGRKRPGHFVITEVMGQWQL